MNSIYSKPLFIYFIFISFFHFSEFLSARIIHGESDRKNWLLSIPYIIALTLSIVEYFAGLKWIAWKKEYVSGFLWIGLAGALIGQTIRLVAVWQAKRAFTHEIADCKRNEHHLIKAGLYRYFRHPGYFGWLLWVTSLQVMLLNPVCTILFAAYGWTFIKHRIAFEEHRLIQFFGSDYLLYRQSTPVRIPFID